MRGKWCLLISACLVASCALVPLGMGRVQAELSPPALPMRIGTIVVKGTPSVGVASGDAMLPPPCFATGDGRGVEAMPILPDAAVDAQLSGSCSGSNGADVWIPDGSCTWANSTIRINCAPAGATVLSVDVYVVIRHTYVGDLVVYMCGSRMCAILWNRSGGSADNIVRTWTGITCQRGEPVNQTWTLRVADCASYDVGYIDYWSITVHYLAPIGPEVIGVTPREGYSCAGAVQEFTTTFREPSGATNIDLVGYLFDTGSWMVDAVYLKYNRNLNLIYLRNESNTDWLGGYAPGDDRIIENRFVRVMVGQCRVTITGENRELRVTWALKFLGDFVGSYNQFLYVSNRSGSYDGWDDAGDWTVLDCGPIATFTPTRTPTQRWTATATPTPTPTEVSVTQQRIPLHTGWNWFSFNLASSLGLGGDCSGLRTTLYFSHYFGNVTVNGQPAPIGTCIEAFSPRGDRVGCVLTAYAGLYPYLRVYGEDNNAGIPGMRPSEAVTFRVNGALATARPASVIWQDDKAYHQVDLIASVQADVATLLASIAGKYDLVLSEDKTFAPPPADSRFNTLVSLQPGQTYLIRMTRAAEEPYPLVINGTLVAANTPIDLAPGWRWPGYLPNGRLAVATALNSISGRYDLVLSEEKTYAPPPADPRFNTLTEMEPGEGYMIRMIQGGTLYYPSLIRWPLWKGPTNQKLLAIGDGFVATPYFTHYFGTVNLNGMEAPSGTLIEMYSPRGERVGSVITTLAGIYPYTRVYGEDDKALPPIPGMKAGETVVFQVNGVIATTDPSVVFWQDDRAIHQVNLTAFSP